MEYILMALFGGGTADWQDIGATCYDWEDIFDKAKEEYDFENVNINTLYEIILRMALEELQQEMKNVAEECSEEFQYCAKNIEEYFNIFANCLDTHLTFTGSEELAEEIQEKMRGKIEEIEDRIGFTYIEF